MLVLVACPVVFAATFVLALIGYPSWMWWAVMAGLVVPVTVFLVVGALLGWDALARRNAY